MGICNGYAGLTGTRVVRWYLGAGLMLLVFTSHVARADWTLAVYRDQKAPLFLGPYKSGAECADKKSLLTQELQAKVQADKEENIKAALAFASTMNEKGSDSTYDNFLSKQQEHLAELEAIVYHSRCEGN
jgi:hypothetical protein